MRYHYTYVSPVGPLYLVSDGANLIGLHYKVFPLAGTDRSADSALPFPATIEQLDKYFRGELRNFELPIRFHGTDFKLRAWDALMEIPYGETISYKTQAERTGSHPRAIGLANGQNPIAIIAPCHRVIGASGKLVGYGGGLDRKQSLLQFEASVRDFGPQPLGAKIKH